MARRASRTTRDGDGGFDMKLGIGTGLVLDATYRTDFSQVEADAQQVNLTRFNLFFPEKREFFLENQGAFQIGRTLRHQRPGALLQPIDRPRERHAGADRRRRCGCRAAPAATTSGC